MELGNYSDITGGREYEVLESYSSFVDWGGTSIIVDSDGRYFVVEERQPDRGSPWQNHWKIKEEYYELFKKPSVKNLAKLLPVKFFDLTLFSVFVEKLKESKALKKLVLEFSKSKIEEGLIRMWISKKRKNYEDEETFKDPVSLGKYVLPGYIYATKFLNEDTLLVEVWPDQDGWDHQKMLHCTIDLKKKVIVEEKTVFKGADDLKFFPFAPDYPIEPVEFGEGYSADVVGQKKTSGDKEVRIKKGKEILHTYRYPTDANLGRLWSFGSLNSVLFMYSMRDHRLTDHYYVLKFDVNGETVKPSTRVVTGDNSTIGISDEGRMAYALREADGMRSKVVQIVQM